ncbi:MAG: hypothetical protein ACTHNG_09570 [Ginsengibacter sp.]
MQRAYRIGSKPFDCGMLAGKKHVGFGKRCNINKKIEEKKNLFYPDDLAVNEEITRVFILVSKHLAHQSFTRKKI